jgi:hypothetical protein
MMLRKTVLFALAAVALAGCKTQRKEPVVVCLDLPTEADNAEARRGIEWWHEPVVYDCAADSIRVHQGEAPASHPQAYGWFDGTQIVWVAGPVFAIVRHEFGHALGYDDSSSGVMACGEVPEPLTPP